MESVDERDPEGQALVNGAQGRHPTGFDPSRTAAADTIPGYSDFLDELAKVIGDIPQPPISANGPDLWSDILARMPVGSVIAGGAVRDYLLGVEPKDIDVFIDIAAEVVCPPEASDGAVFGSDSRFGLHRIDNQHERFEEYAAVSDIVCVSSGVLLGRRVDAVVMENYTGGEALVSAFDFGINQCWFDGEIHDTPNAKRDREARCVTLLSDEREERSLARFERLNERWGGGWIMKRDAIAIEARQGGNAAGGSVHESAAIAQGPQS